jgi:hypothetical protein
MAKKNKKAAWKKKHEEAIRREKLRTEELNKKKRKTKVVVKGKNLKRMGVIPKHQRLQKLKRNRSGSDDMSVDEVKSARSSKRRKLAADGTNDSSPMSNEDAPPAVTEDPIETASQKWVSKELQYDWSKKKKFQVHKVRELYFYFNHFFLAWISGI